MLGDKSTNKHRENPNKALIVYPVNNKKAGKKKRSAIVPHLFLYNPCTFIQ
jgi:hypothetical protein